jgi:hypothetical protein
VLGHIRPAFSNALSIGRRFETRRALFWFTPFKLQLKFTFEHGVEVNV